MRFRRGGSGAFVGALLASACGSLTVLDGAVEANAEAASEAGAPASTQGPPAVAAAAPEPRAQPPLGARSNESAAKPPLTSALHPRGDPLDAGVEPVDGPDASALSADATPLSPPSSGAACNPGSELDLSQPQCLAIGTDRYQRLDALEGAAAFGRALAMRAGTLVAGAEGAAAIIERDDDGAWTIGAVLRPAEPSPSFGASVAISVNSVWIGAPEEDDGRGAVHTFERSDGAWEAGETLRAGDGITRRFGASVALAGATAAIGARDRAFVLEGSAGSFDAPTDLPLDGNSSGYDYHVAASFAAVAVGFTTDVVRGPGTWSRAAALFERADAGWAPIDVLTIPFPYVGTAPCRPALDADTLLIGGAALGRVYRRVGSRWEDESQLTVDALETGYASVRLAASSGDIAVASNPEYGEGAGVAYVFRRDGEGWRARFRIRAESPAPGERFGAAIAVAGDVMAVSSAEGDGSVYLLPVEP
jgi:hypothetical protein